MERRLSRKKRPHRKYYESSAWRCRGGKPRDDPVPEIGSIPVPLGSRFQFYLGPPASLAPLVPPRSSSKRNFIRPVVAILQRGSYKQECGSICTMAKKEGAGSKRERERERERERDSLAGSARDGLQQVVKYERRIVRFKRHLCLSIKFTRLSFQHCAACHFASLPPIIVSYSRSGVSRFHPLASCSRRSRRRPPSSSSSRFLSSFSQPPLRPSYLFRSLHLLECTNIAGDREARRAGNYELPAIKSLASSA